MPRVFSPFVECTNGAPIPPFGIRSLVLPAAHWGAARRSPREPVRRLGKPSALIRYPRGFMPGRHKVARVPIIHPPVTGVAAPAAPPPQHPYRGGWACALRFALLASRYSLVVLLGGRRTGRRIGAAHCAIQMPVICGAGGRVDQCLSIDRSPPAGPQRAVLNAHGALRARNFKPMDYPEGGRSIMRQSPGKVGLRHRRVDWTQSHPTPSHVLPLETSKSVRPA